MQRTLSYCITVLKKDFDFFCDERLAQLGLTRGLLFFLIYIGRHPGCSPSVLSDALRADTGHTARSVDKLVQSGFVLRARSDNDRRAFTLRLTQQGEDTFEAVRALFTEWDAHVLKDADAQECEAALSFLLSLIHPKEGVHGAS